MLENSVDRKRISTVLCTQANGIQSLPRQQSRILKRSCSKSLNRSRSKQNILIKQQNKKNQPQHIFQTKMYRKMLIQSSIWQTNFMDNFEDIIKNQTSEIETIVQNLEQIDMQFQDYFFNNAKNSKKILILNKIEQLQSIIQQQNQIINQFKLYQNQLEDIIKGFTIKLCNIFDQKQNSQIKYFNNINAGENTTEELKQIISKWKICNKDKQKKMQQENKQLRNIVQQMIELMNKKKINPVRNYHIGQVN